MNIKRKRINRDSRKSKTKRVLFKKENPLYVPMLLIIKGHGRKKIINSTFAVYNEGMPFFVVQHTKYTNRLPVIHL